MAKQNHHKKIGLITAALTLSNLLLALPQISSAQVNQDITLQIMPFYDWIIPDTLNLPTTFVSKTQDTWVYQEYNPSNIDEYIKVYDLRNNGGFTVTLTISDFVDGSNTIPYTNVGIVTLANAAQPASVDTPGPTVPQNNPPGTDGGTVFSTLDCDWDEISDFSTTCESTFNDFTGAGATSDAQTIIDGSSPTGAGRVGQYWLALGLRMRIPQNTPAGNYESTFTFTITPEP